MTLVKAKATTSSGGFHDTGKIAFIIAKKLKRSHKMASFTESREGNYMQEYYEYLPSVTIKTRACV